MIPLLVDQNFDERILKGLIQRESNLDYVHVRDVGLAASRDPVVLEWAGVQGRVLLTHDRQTMPGFAYSRVIAGQRMPGVLLVSDEMPIGQAINELLIAVRCLAPEDFEGHVW